MLMSYVELLELIEQGVVQNVEKSQVNAASIDVRLGGHVLYEVARIPSRFVSLKDRDQLDLARGEYPFVMNPGEFILASTMEIFNLPNNISAQFQLKSSGARMGLEHLKAGWCDAGWHGSVLTLELKNMTRWHHIRLEEGAKIGQLVFFKHTPVPDEGSYATKGNYNNDKTVSATKAI